MPTITVKTQIHAPIEICFDLARNIDIHCQTCAWTNERAVAGRTHGLFGANDYVTFEAVHFGIRQRLTAQAVEFEPPHRFAEVMVRGAFQSLRHTHEFVANDSGTLMIDHLEFVSPLGIIGKVADRLFLAQYMRYFLMRRNRNLKKIAESVRS